jgi:hypothetical protein
MMETKDDGNQERWILRMILGGERDHMTGQLSAWLPAVFFGHGNPMNVLMRNQWTEGWGAILPFGSELDL